MLVRLNMSSNLPPSPTKCSTLIPTLTSSSSRSSSQAKSSSSPSMKPTIVLYLMGENAFVADLFRKAMAHDRGLFDVEVVRAMKFEEPKHPWSHYAGVVVSGSTAMVTDHHEFAKKVGSQLRHVVEQAHPPLLGICFGHQLLSAEFGGQVDWIAERQLGTSEVKLHPEAKQDPLFSVFGERVKAMFHVAHRQFVKHLPVSLPGEVKVLASCDVDPHYALKMGAKAWTVQFHPEMTAGVVKNIIKAQDESLKKDGIDPQVRLATVQATDDGERLLHRFVDICLHGDAKFTTAAENNRQADSATRNSRL